MCYPIKITEQVYFLESNEDCFLNYFGAEYKKENKQVIKKSESILKGYIDLNFDISGDIMVNRFLNE